MKTVTAKRLRRDLERFRRRFGMPLDRAITHAVKTLHDAGIETFESCEGGRGHPFPEPTIRFHGGTAEGYVAAGIAIQHGLPVYALRRVWIVIDGQLTGPEWEMVFSSKDALIEMHDRAKGSGAAASTRSP